MEELDATLQVLSSKYNIHFENIFFLPHIIDPRVISKIFGGDKPYHQIQSIPKYKYFYDIGIQHLVEEIYYNDIEQFAIHLYGYIVKPLHSVEYNIHTTLLKY